MSRRNVLTDEPTESTADPSTTDAMNPSTKASRSSTRLIGLVQIALSDPQSRYAPITNAFMSVLAPDPEAAALFLSIQPPATFVLVFEPENGGLWLYLKFQAMIQPIVLLSKRQFQTIEWSERPVDDQVPPVHRLELPPSIFQYMEQVCQRFAPHLQSLIMELIGDVMLVEQETLEVDPWPALVQSQSTDGLVAIVTPSLCGFYLLTSASNEDSLLLRKVVFEFPKRQIVLTDGVVRLSRLVGSGLHFDGPRRVFDATLSFQLIKQSFLRPSVVSLKEITVSNTNTASFIDRSVSSKVSKLSMKEFVIEDEEMEQLHDVSMLCKSFLPPERLPETLCDMITTLHQMFQSTLPSSSWSSGKNALVASILPVVVELLVVLGQMEHQNHQEIHVTMNRLQFCIVYMVSRCDQSIVARLVHQALQLIALRHHIPAALVVLMRSLCAESSGFQSLFHRHDALSLLWNAYFDAAVHPVAPFGQQRPSCSAVYRKPSLLESIGVRRRSHMRPAAPVQWSASTVSLVGASVVCTRVFPTKLQQQELLDAMIRHPNDSKRRDRPSIKEYETSFAIYDLILQQLMHLLAINPSSRHWERDTARLLALTGLFDRLMVEMLHIFTTDEETNELKLRSLCSMLSSLFRLEVVYRRRVCGHWHREPTQYSTFLYQMKAQLRSFDVETSLVSTRILIFHIGFLQNAPRPLIHEYVLVTLEDWLTVTQLIASINSPTSVRWILLIWTLLVQKTRDPDIQILIESVLNVGSAFASIVTLVQQLRGSEKEQTWRFFEAFATMKRTLLLSSPDIQQDGDVDIDAEALEQRKAVLMERLLVSDATTADCAQESLWEFVVARCMDRDHWSLIAQSFWNHDLMALEVYPTNCWHSFLVVCAQYYAIEYHDCAQAIETHWYWLERLVNRTNSLPESENSPFIQLVNDQLRCLIVLITQAIPDPFQLIGKCQLVIQWLQKPSTRTRKWSRPSTTLTEPTTPMEARVPSITGLSMPSLNLSKLGLVSTTTNPLPPIDNNVLLPNVVVDSVETHALVVTLLLCCCVTADGTLDPVVCPRFCLPHEQNEPKIDLLWSLQRHIHSLSSSNISECIERLVLDRFLVSSVLITAIQTLYRLLSSYSYARDWFITATQEEEEEDGESPRERMEYIASGAFATVYKSHPVVPIACNSSVVAIKTLAFQRNAGDRSVVHDVYAEVQILQQLQGQRSAIQLIEFGASDEDVELVFEYCPCTIRAWRTSLEDLELSPQRRLSLILVVFRLVCQAVQQLHEQLIVHCDLKADNILVRTEADQLTRQLLEISGPGLSGLVCLGDFGEALVASVGGAGKTTRTRGTEAIKSPEMLQVDGLSDITVATDLWSLGCLLYELVTQELLFLHEDWAAFYAHLVTSRAPILKAAAIERLHQVVQSDSIVERQLIELLSDLLHRTPTQRPSIPTIVNRLDRIVDQLTGLPLEPDDHVTIRHLQMPLRHAQDRLPLISVEKSPPLIAMKVPRRLFGHVYLGICQLCGPEDSFDHHVVFSIADSSGMEEKRVVHHVLVESHQTTVFLHPQWLQAHPTHEFFHALDAQEALWRPLVQSFEAMGRIVVMAATDPLQPLVLHCIAVWMIRGLQMSFVQVLQCFSQANISISIHFLQQLYKCLQQDK